MADNVIKVSVTSTKSQRVSVSSSKQATNITANSDTGRFWSQISKNWAVSENIVDNEDYSSKYYANKSKESANTAKSYLDTVQDTYNSFASDASSSIGELIDAREAGIVEINEAVASGKDEINSAKTTILNDIEFVADGEKKEIEDLADLIKENAEEIANRTSFAMFDTILKDHILTYEESKGLALQGTYVYKEAIAGSRYGYPDFYNKVIEEFNEATVTETFNNVTVKVHSNGHKFYDIADKEGIDSFFDTMGSAWFYGIDQENERIFLPRDNFFAIKGIAPVVGNGMTLGFTDGTNNYGIWVGSSATALQNTLYGSTVGSGASANNGNNKSVGVTTDATKSGIEAHIEANEDKYLYICVGNTVSQSTVTDVVDVTTTENDTIPLGYSTYQNGTQPSVSWLKSAGQWNDGNIYTTFYNEFIKKIGQDFASGKVVEATDEYTDYDLVINQDDMTFRLPLLDGSEDLVSEKFDNLTLLSSGSTYTAPANGWYSVKKKNASTNQYLLLENLGNGLIVSSEQPTSTAIARMFLPVHKGDTVRVEYTTSGATNYFRFIYAQGNGSLYFKVANAVQNLELLDAGEVMEAVNEINANALTRNNKEEIAGWGIPDYSAGISQSFNTTYIAPSDGELYFANARHSSSGNSACSVTINGNKLPINYSSANYATVTGVVRLSKNDTYSVSISGNSTGVLIFYPLKGVN